ncbi:MAG TPA: hypothetical protein VN643_19095 [Pyrinomonadaceae bacterium]|nr:hypothetical protein [Pyrinomonadaceae bacterium]
MRLDMPLRSLTLTFLILTLCVPAFGQRQSGKVLVEKDTTFALELLSPINSSTNRKGDRFDCKVLSPAAYRGATVSGFIRKVKNAGKANGKSEIDLAFDRITFTDGIVGGFNAHVVEVNEVTNASNGGVADNEGTVKGKSRVKTGVKRAAKGALIGAGIGALLGGAKGAAVGALIGTGVAVTSTVVTEGPNLDFKSGTQFTVMTDTASVQKNPK